MNFEKLRHMEDFTQNMFNRILAFQEKEHQTWDASLDFNQRIRNLPLHYLVFSNGDRNPAIHGPTVNHFYPLRWEMQTLANYMRQLGEDIKITDIQARNGFFASLLGQEGVNVSGVNFADEKPNQIESLADPHCFTMEAGDIHSLEHSDVIVSTWLSPGCDITADIKRIRPAMVVFVYTEARHPETGERVNGCDNGFGEKLLDDYQILDEWDVERPQDLFHTIWPDLTPSPEEVRHTRVLLRKDIELTQQRMNSGLEMAYDWEHELDMALTALQAKAQIEQRGFPTGQSL